VLMSDLACVSVENIKLPPTLLSRFDLIYLILDKPNAEDDRKLAKHITSLYYDDATINAIERVRDLICP